MTENEKAHLNYIRSNWMYKMPSTVHVTIPATAEQWEKRYYRDVPFLVQLIDQKNGKLSVDENMPGYVLDVAHILEGARNGSFEKMEAYAEHLCQRLEAAGERESANHIRKSISGNHCDSAVV